MPLQYAEVVDTLLMDKIFFLAAESMEELIRKVDGWLAGSVEPSALESGGQAERVGALAKLPFRLADVYRDEADMRRRLTEWRLL